jgi:hypothetical protein
MVISGVQFVSMEEQNLEGAVELSQLPVGTAIEYRSGRPFRKVGFPLMDNPLRRTPRFARKKRLAFDAELAARPEYSSPAEVLAARERFRAHFLQQLSTLAPPRLQTSQPRLTHALANTPFEI